MAVWGSKMATNVPVSTPTIVVTGYGAGGAGGSGGIGTVTGTTTWSAATSHDVAAILSAIEGLSIEVAKLRDEVAVLRGSDEAEPI
jgi:hypothetical protein